MLQRKLEGMGAALSQHNMDELMHWYKIGSSLDLLYQIAVKTIDLKDLRAFKVIGDKIEAPKPVKPVAVAVDKPDIIPHHLLPKKDTELIILANEVIRLFIIWLIVANRSPAMMCLVLLPRVRDLPFIEPIVPMRPSC